uniref:uncharacterized protein LOC105757447 n=1 Tax=Odobenus rosmarus divergens TaxID=9708 RepID=UPI00063C9D1B|nr:PREDICTED: uncharacterized protein LOC105757447 [Odobenus rosmarus divergens]
MGKGCTSQVSAVWGCSIRAASPGCPPSASNPQTFSPPSPLPSREEEPALEGWDCTRRGGAGGAASLARRWESEEQRVRGIDLASGLLRRPGPSSLRRSLQPRQLLPRAGSFCSAYKT